jgi:hypothetical protein
MLRGPLHNRGADGLCEACGEPFPCQTAIAIYEAVKRELEHPAAPPQSVTPPPPIVQDFQRLGNLPPCVGRTSTTAGHRCPRCLHCWESHGVPSEDGYGCMMIENSMAERAAMSDRMHELERRGVPPGEASAQAFKALHYCGCTFAKGNTVIPPQVRTWDDGSSDPTPTPAALAVVPTPRWIHPCE